MKKLIIIFVVLFCVSGCAQPDSIGEPVTIVRYDSLADLVSAAKSPSEYDEIADLSSLSNISVPNGIPNGYSLYKVTAGAADIAFWYLPDELLVSEDSILTAEAEQKHFMFVDGRESYDFDEVLKQFGGNHSRLIKQKYFVTTSTTRMIVWEDNDGSVLMLYLPKDYGVSFAETDSNEKNVSTSNKSIITQNNITDYCSTENYIIE